jgi:predicted phosphodiesterase
MKRLFFILSVLLLIPIDAGCNDINNIKLCSDKTTHFQQKSFRFIVASDPQLFRGNKEDLVKAVESINTYEPAFVIMCGDLIENPSNPDQIQAYKDSMAYLSPTISLYNIPGNHDLGHPVTVENITVYQKNFGPLWFHFIHGNTLFIILCSDILRDNNAPMNNQQTEWLMNILRQSQSTQANRIFVFMHHPLYLKSPDEPDGYSNMPGIIRSRLLELFLKHHVQAVFSGHLHDNRENNYQGMALITTNSITVPMGKDPAGFRIIDVYPDKYEEKYHVIEQPEKLEKAY